MENTIVPLDLTPEALLTPRFGSVDACAAIGCNTQWLKNVLSRSPIVVALPPQERKTVGDRQYFEFSLRSIVHLALVKKLARNMPLPLADIAASNFTRLPSTFDPELFARHMADELRPGDGYLVARICEAGLVDTRIAHDGTELRNVFVDDRADGAVIVSLGQVMANIISALDLDEAAGELLAE